MIGVECKFVAATSDPDYFEWEPLSGNRRIQPPRVPFSQTESPQVGATAVVSEVWGVFDGLPPGLFTLITWNMRYDNPSDGEFAWPKRSQKVFYSYWLLWSNALTLADRLFFDS